MVYTGLVMGGTFVSLHMQAGRSVCTRLMPHGSGMVYGALVSFVSRLLVRIRLKTSASEIVCTLRAHCRREVETLFQVLMIRRYTFISCEGRRQLSALTRSRCVVACVLS